MRLQKWFAVLLVAFLAGCGGDEGSSSPASGPDPARAIPAGAPVYVEAVLRPEGEQGDNARELLGRFLGDRSFESIVDDALTAEGRTYAEDIEPWLGERAAVGVFDLAADEPGFVAAFASTDAEQAEALLADQGKKGTTIGEVQLYEEDGDVAGVVGDYVIVAASEAEMRRAIETLDGESIVDDERFQDAMGELPSERLGALYVDMQAIGELAAQDPSVDPAAKGIIDQLFGEGGPITAALTAQPDAATIESRLSRDGFKAFAPYIGGEAPELIADAPAGSWAVFGYTDVGSTIKAAIDTFAGAFGGAAIKGQLESQTGLDLERDFFSWVGDLAVFVRGETLAELDGAIVIEASDAGAAEEAVPRIVAAARRAGAPLEDARVDGADLAFSTPLPDAPGPLVMAYGNDRVVFAVGEQAAADGLAPQETISDSGLYERAQDAIDGVEPAAILDLATVLRFAESTGGTDDPDYQEAKPYLDQLDLLVTGAEEDGDQLRSLFTVKAK